MTAPTEAGAETRPEEAEGVSPEPPAGGAPGETGTAEPPETGRLRAALLYALPLLALFFLVVALPLARGTETLVLRDVLNSHLPLKWSQAIAMKGGTFPLLDPFRAGGQPLAGNPNAVPFYPDNLLYLVASPLWALNAHFWIHLLLAPFAFYALARAWGLSRGPSWAAAACYAGSGYFLSQLNFYNLIAGAALTPLLAALALRLARPGARLALVAPALALVWALLLVAGDPQTALLAFLLAASALLLAPRGERGAEEAAPAIAEAPGGRPARPYGLFVVAFACGTLLALPQLVEFLRILPGSFRGRHGYTPGAVLTSSFDPRQAAEWFLPFLFGRPETLREYSFWGQPFFTGVPPYFLSLYPGALSLALFAAAGFQRARAALWAWGAVAVGVFFALGKFNPVGTWFFVVATQKTLRFPIKFWLLVAVGAALLCGLGFERLARGERGAARRFASVLAALGALLAALWAFLNVEPRRALEAFAHLIPRSAAFQANERIRWSELCVASLAVLALLALAFLLRQRSRLAAGALLLAIHAGSQLYFLRPLYTTDATVPYKVRPPALDLIPRGALLVSPDFNHLFGSSVLSHGKFPENHTRWLERRSAYELYPFTGPRWGNRYELNSSPEGLDSYEARMAQTAIKEAEARFKQSRMLAAWGVRRLLMNHPLEPLPPLARLVRALPSFGGTLYVYEILEAADPAFLASRVYREPNLQAAFQRLADVGFQPRTDAVVVGPPEAPRLTGGGTARVLLAKAEEWKVETEAGPGGALLVVQRADVLFEATIDGEPAPVVTTNGYRVGVEVPEGKHLVRLAVDRKPFRQAVLGSVLGLLLLPLLALRGRRAGLPKGDAAR